MILRGAVTISSSLGVMMVMMGVMMTMVGWETVRGQNVVFSDEEAGTHLNTLSPRGIGLSVKWFCFRFKMRLDNIMATLSEAEDQLDLYEAGALPNITAIVEEKLAGMFSLLDNAEALAESKGLNNTGDDLIAFMWSNTGTVNVGSHYDSSTFIFTVPKAGLYMVLIRSLPWDSSFSCTVSRNGNETLLSLDHINYYDMRTRIRLLWLNAADQIYTTNDDPAYFKVTRLRLQTLMPDFLSP